MYIEAFLQGDEQPKYEATTNLSRSCCTPTILEDDAGDVVFVLFGDSMKRPLDPNDAVGAVAIRPRILTTPTRRILLMDAQLRQRESTEVEVRGGVKRERRLPSKLTIQADPREDAGDGRATRHYKHPG